MYLLSIITPLTLFVSLLPTTSSVGDSNGQAFVERAIVKLSEDIEVPAQAPGVLVALDVDDGDLVEIDHPVALIDDRDAQMKKRAAEIQLEAARKQASNKIPVIYAAASHKVAKAELEENREANRKVSGTVPQVTIRRLELQVEESRLLIQKNQLDIVIATMNADVHLADVESAEQDIQRRRILAPINGMVVERARDKGEWVQAGEVLMRIVRMDVLRVEGLLSAKDFDQYEIEGRPVKVCVELARGEEMEFQGQIVFVDPVVQFKGRYLVRAEVKNEKKNGAWVLKPGIEATMAISIR